MKSVRRACALLAVAAALILAGAAGAPFNDGQRREERAPALSMSGLTPFTVDAWERERAAFVERMKFSPAPDPALAACNSIRAAVAQFHESYSHLPDPVSASIGLDSEVDTSGPEGLVGILIGKDPEKNPRKLDFIGDMKQATERSDGRLVDGLILAEGDYSIVDPWGEFYYVKLDLDYDNEMDNPNVKDATGGHPKVRASCVVWSGGQDRDKDTWNDNIMSWSK